MLENRKIRPRIAKKFFHAKYFPGNFPVQPMLDLKKILSF